MALVVAGIVLIVLGIALSVTHMLGFTLGIPLLGIGVALLVLGLVFALVSALFRPGADRRALARRRV